MAIEVVLLGQTWWNLVGNPLWAWLISPVNFNVIGPAVHFLQLSLFFFVLLSFFLRRILEPPPHVWKVDSLCFRMSELFFWSVGPNFLTTTWFMNVRLTDLWQLKVFYEKRLEKSSLIRKRGKSIFSNIYTQHCETKKNWHFLKPCYALYFPAEHDPCYTTLLSSALEAVYKTTASSALLNRMLWEAPLLAC